jgi:alkanesulfonate monooxygenase SsuD/methylene tetrahydromethanopterin reductase-like flavin-dependent oxidoreductase (luciferase family)
MRRAATLGDGWYPIGSNPRFPLRTPEQLSLAVERLRQYAEAGDRDPATIDLAFSAGWYDEHTAGIAADGGRLSLTGSPEQVSADINAFAEVGVRHMMLNFQGPTLEETQDRMGYFANEIAPLVK